MLTVWLQEFVVRSQRYPALALAGRPAPTRRRLTLVEDVPNAAVRDPSAFHAVLEAAAVSSAAAPLVLVVSDRSEDGREVAKLFPREVMDVIMRHPSRHTLHARPSTTPPLQCVSHLSFILSISLRHCEQ